MKYPFKFTETFIADVTDINAVELIDDTTLHIGFKISGDIAKVKYDTPEHCKTIFDSFCKIVKGICEMRARTGELWNA